MLRLAVLSVLLACVACSGTNYASRDQMLDPATCAGCHPTHYQDWAGSMHAYAAEDPVFLAMNKRGQRETSGALGSFCVQCHAPMAVRENATTDGLNLASVPPKLHGVTCYFCHTVTGVQDTHNNALVLASDTVMRAVYADPLANSAHPAAYSEYHDRDRAQSSALCGSCHDVVTPSGGAIERTYSEWQQSVFAQPGGATCSQCHMNQSATLQPIAQYPGAQPRSLHAHTWPGADTALTAFPDAARQKAQMQDFLNTTLQTALCVRSVGNSSSLRVIVENVAAGHAWPSGSAQDRRAFAEVIAYQRGSVIYQSGVVTDGSAVTQIKSATDPDLWLIRDCLLDGTGKPVNMFWQASSFESNLLPTQVTADITDPRYYQTHLVQDYPRAAGGVFTGAPDKVTLRLRLQPMGLDVLDDLVQSGDLDPAVRAAMPTYDLGMQPVLTWTAATAKDAYRDTDGTLVYCISTSNLSAQGDKFPAVNHVKCSP